METVQVTIYQLPAEHKMMFQGSNEWKEKMLRLEKSIYHSVYSFQIPKDALTCGMNAILEEIFIRFNDNLPKGFCGHSLSVSDVVMIDNEAYYVERIGFSLLKSF